MKTQRFCVTATVQNRSNGLTKTVEQCSPYLSSFGDLSEDSRAINDIKVKLMRGERGNNILGYQVKRFVNDCTRGADRERSCNESIVPIESYCDTLSDWLFNIAAKVFG